MDDEGGVKGMSLGQRENCHRYPMLGIERLEILCQAIRGIKYDPDPIHRLLRKCSLYFAGDGQISPADDAIRNSRRLKQSINRLKTTEAVGGSARGYLELLKEHRGRGPPVMIDRLVSERFCRDLVPERIIKMSKKSKKRKEKKAALMPVVPDSQVIEIGPMGSDSSSSDDIGAMYKQEMAKVSTVSIAETWLNKVAAGGVHKEAEIKNGTEVAGNLSVSFNKFLHFTAVTMAGLAILIGRVCIALKELTGEEGFNWVKWANRNLTSLHPRKRERCISLASRPDCWPYVMLGLERLELLVQATSGSKSKDPIGDLLKQNKILYSEGMKINVPEFKTMVDAALNVEKLRKQEITVEFGLVKSLTELNVQFDQNLFRKLREAKGAGGTEKGYLEMLHRNGGKALAMPEDEKKLQNFSALTVRLKEVSEYYLKAKDQKPDELKKIDVGSFKELIERLDELKGILIPTGEPKSTTV